MNILHIDCWLESQKLMENPTTTHKHCKIVDSESFLLFYKDRYFLGTIGKNKIQYLKSHNMFF